MTNSPEPEDPYSTLDEIPRFARVENVERYVAGGLHPLHIGDRIGPDERFEVRHKLGYSDTSTVWLCLDRKDGRHVGVKILQAEVSSTSHPELTALRLFEGLDRRELRSNRLLMVEEHFWIDGPNGRHLCFVVQVLGPAISYALPGVDLDTPDLLTDLCFQASQIMKYLHDKKICHGDFRPDHTRLQLDFDKMTGVKIYDLFGEPKVWHLKDSKEGEDANRRPKYLVEAANTADLEAKYRTGQIAVDSFATAYLEGEKIEPRVLDPNYAAPEIRFLKHSSGFSSDIWSLGSMIHLVRTAKLLLACLPSDSSLVSWLAWAHGPFPQESWNSIGEFLSTDSAVPVFTANAIAQELPKSPQWSTFGSRSGKEASGYPVEWGYNRREAITLLLGEEETPRALHQRKLLQGGRDRKRYLRVKLPKNWSTWTKFQEQRRRLTGYNTLLHEDLRKERQWYICTEPPSDEEDSSETPPGRLDDAVLQRLNGSWNAGLDALSAEQVPEEAETQEVKTHAKNENTGGLQKENGKRSLLEAGIGSSPKKAKTFVTERDLRDLVERVEQRDGMTKFSYRLQATEVDILADLLGKMLKNDPKERIGIDEVLGHEWFEHSRGRLV
ncbi:kinase-like domain-containing protein [Xylaria nigripes]|nr:kinase-like domain-containing protein [Xylaria nigripes]